MNLPPCPLPVRPASPTCQTSPTRPTCPTLTATHETLYLPLIPGRQAIMTVTIQSEGLHPMDRPALAPPTARELHAIAELLYHRAYQFHPED